MPDVTINAAVKATETAEAWLNGEATEDDCYHAAMNARKYKAVAVAVAEAVRAVAVAEAAVAAAVEAVRSRDDALLDFLDDLLDAWDKARAEEGVLSDVPVVPAQPNGS